MRQLSPLSCQDPQLSCPVPSQPRAALRGFSHCTVGSKIISFSFCLELAGLLPPTVTIAVLSKRNLLCLFMCPQHWWYESSLVCVCCCCRHPPCSLVGQLSTWSLFCLAPKSTSPSSFCLVPLKMLFGHHL